MAEEIFYKRGDLSAQDLQADVQAFFELAGDDPAARQDALDAGVDLDELLGQGPTQVEVKPDSAGLTGLEEALIVMLLTPVVQSGWKDVVLPWLQRRRGRPVGEQVQPQD
jgi:hypothetical protein